MKLNNKRYGDNLTSIQAYFHFYLLAHPSQSPRIFADFTIIQKPNI